MANELKYRCYNFSLKTIKYLKSKKWDSFSLIIAKQVLRSAMSVGVNVIEATHSSSRTEFKRYYEIALKSSNETKYWFCLLRDGFDCAEADIKNLLKECNELSKILASSVLTLKKKKENGNK
jgi:four helix bundle protein